MIKVLAYLTLTLVTLFSIVFLTKYLPYMVESYFPIENYLQESQNISVKNDTKRLEYLDQLVEMPIVGRFFFQEKVSELISLAKYKQTIHWAQKAISDPFYTRSFPLWYYKAVSECLLMQYSDCESSLTWASFYATPEAEPYITSVYRFLQSKENKQQKEVDVLGSMVVIEVEKETTRSELEQL